MNAMSLDFPLTAQAVLCLLPMVLSYFVLRRALTTRVTMPTRIVRRPTGIPSLPARLPRNARKPPWVIEEVLHLRALSGCGCLKIAQMFNRRHADNGMSVGKTFVAKTINVQAHRLLMIERDIRNAQPRQVANNVIWGIDLTEVRINRTTAIPVLGVIDHGSRASLNLLRLHEASSIAVLEILLIAIRRFGKPKVIRSDNGSIFTSALFRWTLIALGIGHQRTEPFMPWQNGRIERFFGTLKAAMAQVIVPSAEILQPALDEFRFFYNHIRPHTAIGGRTPAEAWSRTAKPKTAPIWFEAWDGVLTGDYYPP
jgi:transposase InsO family protein